MSQQDHHSDDERTEVIGAEAPTSTSTTTSADPGTEHTTWMGDWQEQDVASTDESRSGLAEGVHPLQTGYLVLGLLAIGTALMWLLTETDVIAIGDGSAAFSVVLITAGAIGLIASLGRALRR